MRQAERTRATRAWVLAAGDAAAILVFVLVGLRNHKEGLTAAGLARTAVPILGVWFAISPFTKTYARPGIRSLLSTWIVAVPAGLAIRAVILHRGATGSEFAFAAVALTATLVFLLVWRGVAAGSLRARRPV